MLVSNISIKKIDENYCTDNSVFLKPDSLDNLLIMDSDHILYLKENDIRKEPPLLEFQFQYNKLYLNVKNSLYGIQIHQDYFISRKEGNFYLSKSLKFPNKHIVTDELITSREEAEDILNPSNYDSFCLLDLNGIILYAKSKNDGVIIDRNIIPSDKEIIDKELENRTFRFHLTHFIGLCGELSAKPININQIKNVSIYGPILFTNKFGHIMITSNQLGFHLVWFRLDFLEQDKFKITTSEIPIFDNELEYKEYFSEKPIKVLKKIQ